MPNVLDFVGNDRHDTNSPISLCRDNRSFEPCEPNAPWWSKFLAFAFADPAVMDANRLFGTIGSPGTFRLVFARWLTRRNMTTQGFATGSLHDTCISGLSSAGLIERGFKQIFVAHRKWGCRIACGSQWSSGPRRGTCCCGSTLLSLRHLRTKSVTLNRLGDE